MFYFNDCATLDELKKKYRELVKKFHPDCGGDVETMKAINTEYEKAFNRLKHEYNRGKTDEYKTHETATDYILIIEKLLHMEGIKIEQCGCWLWLSGNTYPYRGELSSIGFKWARNKKMWFWTKDEIRKTRHSTDMETIREKYGSKIFDTVPQYKLV